MSAYSRLFLIIAVGLILVACVPVVDETPVATTSAPLMPILTSTVTLAAPLPTTTPTQMPILTLTPTPAFPPQVDCEAVFCEAPWQGLLARPIGPEGVQTIDPTYPYANTKNGTLEPHHGVEFPNGTGTPVLAAQDGEVVFAGTDDLTVLGPYTGFYGNVVIVRHAGLFEGRDLYTLYAHLSAVDVVEGQEVAPGERIGAVGLSGAANGSHLHFEVRLDENDYAHTTNPVLWLGPIDGNEGGAGSMLAGVLLDPDSRPVDLTTLELDRVGRDGTVLQKYYPVTYFPSGVNANPILNENFVFPDLPPGDYQLNYIWDHYYTFDFSLSAGSLGFIKIQLD